LFKKYTLKNGVRLIIAPREETNAVAVMVGVAVGSRYEPENLSGVSHFIEHMSFKGSKKRPTPSKVNDFINDIGGIYNAYTDKELTAYHVKISSDHLVEVLDYLSDNLINPINSKEEFNREKNVVIEDIKMHKDRPMEEVIELFEENIFTEKSLGRRIAGTVESVRKIKHEELLEFEQDHYIAENIVVVICGNLGNLTEEKVVCEAEKYFTAKSGKKSEIITSGTLDVAREVSGQRKTEQTNLIIGFAGPGLRDLEDRYAFKILAEILGGSSSSRMFVEVREKLGLAYAAETEHIAYSDAGSLVTLANVAHENIEKASRAIINEYRKIVKDGPKDEEIKRAKELMKSAISIGMEDSENLAESLMRMEIIHEKLMAPEEVIAKFEEVTAKDVIRVAKKYINFDKMLVSVVGPFLDDKKLKKILNG
jgi:predicted Zn-dependent peptidase